MGLIKIYMPWFYISLCRGKAIEKISSFLSLILMYFPTHYGTNKDLYASVLYVFVPTAYITNNKELI